MAQPAGNGPVSVVSPTFCVPRPVSLAISQTFWGDYVVKDVNGNLMFKVNGASLFSFRNRNVIRDAAGTPIVNLRAKIFTAHSTWKVFRGENSEDELIFSAKRSSMFQMKTKLHVFLPNNTSEDVCDYTLRGSWLGGSCEVYVGDSSTMVAHMHENSSLRSMFTGKNKFLVTVYPNVDYAFIVALIVILDQVNSQNGGGGGGGGD